MKYFKLVNLFKNLSLGFVNTLSPLLYVRLGYILGTNEFTWTEFAWLFSLRVAIELCKWTLHNIPIITPPNSQQPSKIKWPKSWE